LIVAARGSTGPGGSGRCCRGAGASPVTNRRARSVVEASIRSACSWV